MKKVFITIVLFLAVIVSAQTKDPKKLIDAVRQKFNKVNDYKVDVSVKLDMSFVKVPDMKAKVYFKKPDKLKVEAEGFAMLPKEGLKFSPAELFKDTFTPLYVRTETISNKKLDVIKAIPNNDSSNIVITTLWIDAVDLVIRKVETTTRNGGTTQSELMYDNAEYGLPSQIKISFNLGNMQVPANLPNQSNETGDAKKDKKRRGMGEGVSIKGSVTMSYTNYQINKGVPDSIFEEKEKKK